MAYMSVIGNCICCDRLFSFNPHYVPSYRVTPGGPREPVCKDCIDAANRKREVPLLIHPRAYEPEQE